MLSQIANDEYVDMFDDDDDSDSESSDSHDDDISIVTTDAFATRKKTFSKKKNKEDFVTDFDKEMENELCDTINALESVRKLSASGKLLNTDILSATGSDQQQTANEGDRQSVSKDQLKADQYDDIYFDSDEEIEKTDAGNSLADNKHKVLSNDELFYDPEMDEKDQIWMDKRRLNPQLFYSKTKKSKTPKNHTEKKTDNDGDANASTSKNTKRKKKQMLTNRRAPRSDAVLDCPACMTTLCIDCQKHATFPHQYRAMFVMNCTIDFAERFKYPRDTDRKKKRKVAFIDEEADDISNMLSPSSGNEKDDVYYSVKCDECRTKVAMYDKDEVYHFFNVISSYG